MWSVYLPPHATAICLPYRKKRRNLYSSLSKQSEKGLLRLYEDFYASCGTEPLWQ